MTNIEWVQKKDASLPPADSYSETRDHAQARVERLRTDLIRSGWNEGAAALASAVVGELVNNSFDHNIGAWRDIAGCWFSSHVDGASLSIEIADRGQGVLHSLQHVRPTLKSDHDALVVAFTERLSGRAPENRGNGLKFVLRALARFAAAELRFQSGDAELHVRHPGMPTDISSSVRPTSSPTKGTCIALRLTTPL